MKYSYALFALAGIAQGAALHQRTPEERVPRVHKSRAERQHKMNNRVGGPKVLKTGGARVQYSTNWAGVVKHSTGITRVSGNVVVPGVGNSAQGSGGAAWVGIDGDSCGQALLQTGIDFYGDGSYDAWWEWIPDNVVFFDNFPLSEGDEIFMEVDATSKKTGVATLQNLTTGKKVTHKFTSSATPSTLCETDAEWIVEDFLGNLANFNPITFTNNTATGSQGTFTPAGGDILDIRTSQNVVETDCGLSGNNVVCKYTGP